MLCRRIASKFTKNTLQNRSSSILVNLPSYLENGPQTDITTTNEGLRIVSQTISGNHTATIGVWIDVGSRYETASTNGLAHFLEHLAFNGTEKRSRQQFLQEAIAMDAQLHAGTNQEQIFFQTTILQNNIRQAMDILSDMVLHPKLDPSDIEYERNVILNEMKERHEEEQLVILNHLQATAYQNQSLGRVVIGTEESIRSLRRKDFVEFIDRYYRPERIVIAGAGAIDHEELCDLAKEYFVFDKSEPIDVVLEPAKFIGSEVRIHLDSNSIAHVALAYEGFSWTSEYMIPLMLLQAMIGVTYDQSAQGCQDVTSKLFQEVAQNDLAHSISSFHVCFKDTGTFGLHLVAPDDKLDDLIYCVMNNLVRMIHEPSQEELDHAKIFLKSHFLMGLSDGHTKVAEDIGRQLLAYGRRLSPVEIYARIESVQLEDVKATANRIINDKDHVLAAMGSISNLPDYGTIRRNSFRFIH